MKIVGTILTALALVSIMSCSKKQKEMSKSEIKAKVDSTVATRIDDLNRQAMEDLDRRKSIEVKAKADSIVDAYVRSQQPVADSASAAKK